MDGLIGVTTGDKAEVPDDVVGGLIGERFVGEATVREERLRDNATVPVGRSGRSC